MAGNTTDDAHDALVAQLGAYASSAFPDAVTRDKALAGDEVQASLNVLKSQQPPQVLGEQMGLGEDDVLVEYVQTFDVEWIVRAEVDADRLARFTQGLKDIAAALYADRSLGGQASGLNIGPPNYENHTLAGAPNTAAVLIPVRVSLRGTSMLS